MQCLHFLDVGCMIPVEFLAMDTALLNQEVFHIPAVRDGLVLDITLLCDLGS